MLQVICLLPRHCETANMNGTCRLINVTGLQNTHCKTAWHCLNLGEYVTQYLDLLHQMFSIVLNNCWTLWELREHYKKSGFRGFSCHQAKTLFMQRVSSHDHLLMKYSSQTSIMKSLHMNSVMRLVLPTTSVVHFSGPSWAISPVCVSMCLDNNFWTKWPPT